MRAVLLVIGFVCVALGAVGVIVPVLPTVPFLLAASVCFAKGSERFSTWFLSTKLYQKHLESFVRERAMKRSTKIAILLLASVMLGLAFVLMQNIAGRICVAVILVLKYYFFLFKIKTLRPRCDVKQIDEA